MHIILSTYHIPSDALSIPVYSKLRSFRHGAMRTDCNGLYSICVSGGGATQSTRSDCEREKWNGGRMNHTFEHYVDVQNGTHTPDTIRRDRLRLFARIRITRNMDINIQYIYIYLSLAELSFYGKKIFVYLRLVYSFDDSSDNHTYTQ